MEDAVAVDEDEAEDTGEADAAGEAGDAGEAEDSGEAAAVSPAHGYTYPCSREDQRAIHQHEKLGVPSVLRPGLPQEACACGMLYNAEGYIGAGSRTVYLPAPWFACQRPVQHLQCANRLPECTIEYDPRCHGLFAASRTILMSARCASNQIGGGGWIAPIANGTCMVVRVCFVVN